MTLLLRSQRLLREPTVTRGDRLTCTDYDGTQVEVTVTWPEPPRDRGQCVHGLAGGKPVTVMLVW